MNINLFSDRIKHLIDRHESTSNLARMVGVSEGVVRKWKDGKSEPTRDKLEALSKATGVRIEWLVLGTGEVSDKAQGNIAEFALIPGYNVQVSAGNGSIPGNEEPTRRLAFRHRWLKYRGLNEKDLVMVFTKGDSMEPTIADNNTLMVDTSDTDPQDGGIYVIRNDGHLLVKRTQIAPGQGVWLISDNKEYDKLLVQFDKTEDLEVIGRVVWIGKDI